jgi:hypothetical protein
VRRNAELAVVYREKTADAAFQSWQRDGLKTQPRYRMKDRTEMKIDGLSTDEEDGEFYFSFSFFPFFF